MAVAQPAPVSKQGQLAIAETGIANTTKALQSDIILASFESSDYEGWNTTGTAFGTRPAKGAFPNQKPVTGFLSHGFVNSMLGGDKATGTLTSPDFQITREFITFLIGGGGWTNQTCVNLMVGDKVVRTSTGPNTKPGGSEELTPALWDVTELATQTAHIQIVDQATGRWGHINVDHIVLTDTKPAELNTVSSAANEPDMGDGELLYNGIQLPKRWPPWIKNPKNRAIRPVPYLVRPPTVIPIDVGRQLFVDDFLIEQTDLTRTLHHPERYAGNPVLKPETELELNNGEHPMAALFNDGVWFDPKDHQFKIWYHAGWFDGTAYATSKDGLNWERPKLDVVPNSNRILPVANHGKRDGSAVWLDHFTTDPSQRFKMFLYERPETNYGGQVFSSPDGIHWSSATRTSLVGDNTTILYNPFRKKWVYSVRTSLDGRTRSYRECDDLFAGAQWSKDDLVYWAGADELDQPDPQIGDRTQLYNLDAVAYESLMLGVFTIHRGPANDVCAKLKRSKLTDLTLAFSRDGFHWHRPEHEAFLAGTRKEGDWDRAYLHSAATICTITGDRLYFYYSAFSGISPKLGSHMYAGASTGVAMLRRDGFASLDAGDKAGTLTTRPISFKGKYLFINLHAPQGELRAEVLDVSGKTIAPFTMENGIATKSDSTRLRLDWKGAEDLSSLSGRNVRFRFQLRKGQFYAFWVSPVISGASHGYVAAGGPGFTGATDTTGQ